ncbi:MAG TPA: sigma-70 family RNA polymerase sigma factor [Deltaproteobacteria bacterium]|nr:sigma-70 family RNA polymerase sigma factor [Deltaproteobacteria bacterium]
MELTDAELTALYDRYAHVLFHRCRSILRNDEEAWDAVQETFARVVKNADTFRQQSSALTWMYKISTNYSLNQLRNRNTRARSHRDRRDRIVGPEVSVPPEEATEDHQRILGLLDDADPQTRACIVHTYFDDCTREETARLVGLSVPTVRKRINTFLVRARRQLGVAVALLASSPWILP